MKRQFSSHFIVFLLACVLILLHGCSETKKIEETPTKPVYHVKELPWPPSVFDFSFDSSEPSFYGAFDYHLPLPSNMPNTKIIIDKKKHALYLYSGMELVRWYPVSLGRDPDNDKEKEGDGRTPEGIFYICSKNPASSYFLSLGISYPNMEDAERGLREGIITRAQYERIVNAMKKRQRPPWFTKLGGAICIHGGGVDWDWTAGCIAMENRHVRELFRAVSVGTPVIIKKSAGFRRDFNLWPQISISGTNQISLRRYLEQNDTEN